MLDESFSFKASIWLTRNSQAAWHFISVPQDYADQIKFMTGSLSNGWGSVPVMVTIGKSCWQTSIFPDKRSGSYILPVKASIRKAEKLGEGDEAVVKMSLQLNV
ncbi:DUF1905 domain-containing protein [Flexibacterium corallicola]|uniref:DUF1905 domain-containing protein n=1 Tax=Flexibacterium corallicola TaxID=3037259 RepID=UPI00286F2A4E|nr:DUF1905 domain-containing protein [Pseudovibrio sp. M1P-2-3]